MKYTDSRIKKRILPVWTFLFAYVLFAVLTTMQLQILHAYIDYKNIPLSNALAVFFLWVLVASGFTLWMVFYIRMKYEIPIGIVSDAARSVASGKLETRIVPMHSKEKATVMDVLVTDFNHMANELENLEMLKSDFISNVSHEFKTPLSIIRSNAQMLLMNDTIQEEFNEQLSDIIDESDKLVRLVSNLLKLSRLENQGNEPVLQMTDLRAQLERCALEFEQAWEEKDIVFIAELDTPCIVKSDGNLLEIIWTNLISNAIKFTGEGGTVVLSLNVDETKATVTVSDTGPGIPEELLDRIFDKFYQVDSSRSSEGNGLGLALVKCVSEILNLSVSVESTVGKGSSFKVQIPLL